MAVDAATTWLTRSRVTTSPLEFEKVTAFSAFFMCTQVEYWKNPLVKAPHEWKEGRIIE